VWVLGRGGELRNGKCRGIRGKQRLVADLFVEPAEDRLLDFHFFHCRFDDEIDAPERHFGCRSGDPRQTRARVAFAEDAAFHRRGVNTAALAIPARREPDRCLAELHVIPARSATAQCPLHHSRADDRGAFDGGCLRLRRRNDAALGASSRKKDSAIAGRIRGEQFFDRIALALERFRFIPIRRAAHHYRHRFFTAG
jgi:hypothetical protein